MLGLCATAAPLQGTPPLALLCRGVRVACGDRGTGWALPGRGQRKQHARRLYCRAQKEGPQQQPAADGPEEAAPSSVTFLVNMHVSFGQEIRVVGSSPVLGSWDCASAPAMEWSEGDNWNLTVELPRGRHEFKLVVTSKGDSFNWEGGSNRVLQVPDPLAEANSAGAFTVVCEWSHTEAMLATPPEGPVAVKAEGEGQAQAALPATDSDEGEPWVEDMSGESIGAPNDEDEPSRASALAPGRPHRREGTDSEEGEPWGEDLSGVPLGAANDEEETVTVGKIGGGGLGTGGGPGRPTVGKKTVEGGGGADAGRVEATGKMTVETGGGGGGGGGGGSDAGKGAPLGKGGEGVEEAPGKMTVEDRGGGGAKGDQVEGPGKMTVEGEAGLKAEEEKLAGATGAVAGKIDEQAAAKGEKGEKEEKGERGRMEGAKGKQEEQEGSKGGRAGPREDAQGGGEKAKASGKIPTAPVPVEPTDRPSQSPATAANIEEVGGQPAGSLSPQKEKEVQDYLQSTAEESAKRKRQQDHEDHMRLQAQQEGGRQQGQQAQQAQQRQQVKGGKKEDDGEDGKGPGKGGPGGSVQSTKAGEHEGESSSKGERSSEGSEGEGKKKGGGWVWFSASSEGESPSEGTQLAAAALGLLALPMVGWSEYTLKTTGCGLPPGPSGLLGAAEGISYLAVAGLVLWSLGRKLASSKGLPAGPAGLLGLVEGGSWLAVGTGLAVLAFQVKTYGYIPSALPDANCFGEMLADASTMRSHASASVVASSSPAAPAPAPAQQAHRAQQAQSSGPFIPDELPNYQQELSELKAKMLAAQLISNRGPAAHPAAPLSLGLDGPPAGAAQLQLAAWQLQAAPLLVLEQPGSLPPVQRLRQLPLAAARLTRVETFDGSSSSTSNGSSGSSLAIATSSSSSGSDESSGSSSSSPIQKRLAEGLSSGFSQVRSSLASLADPAALAAAAEQPPPLQRPVLEAVEKLRQTDVEPIVNTMKRVFGDLKEGFAGLAGTVLPSDSSSGSTSNAATAAGQQQGGAIAEAPAPAEAPASVAKGSRPGDSLRKAIETVKPYEKVLGPAVEMGKRTSSLLQRAGDAAEALIKSQQQQPPATGAGAAGAGAGPAAAGPASAAATAPAKQPPAATAAPAKQPPAAAAAPAKQPPAATAAPAKQQPTAAAVGVDLDDLGLKALLEEALTDAPKQK